MQFARIAWLFYSDKYTVHSLPNITQPYPILPNITHLDSAYLQCKLYVKIT